MLAIVAPGQGTQTPGMLAPWLALGGVRATLGGVLEPELVGLGTDAGADAIRDTAVAQPLIVATGLAAAAALAERCGGDGVAVPASVVSGHSVGEWTAAAVAGHLDPADVLGAVRLRGSAMAAAGALQPGSLAAVLGGDEQAVLDAVQNLGLTLANHNGPGQLVVGGSVSALQALQADPPARARVRLLDVSGAFHTPAMAPAEAQLAAHVADLEPRAGGAPVVSNLDGGVVWRARDLVTRMVRQVSAPVRWDACIETFARIGVTAVVELAPAGTLTAILRRQLPGVQTLALSSPDQLDAAADLVAAHAAPFSAEPAPDWSLAVAPVNGTFRTGSVRAGAVLDDGAALGTVVDVRGTASPVAAPAGVLTEWLASDRDPVAAGDPIARVAHA